MAPSNNKKGGQKGAASNSKQDAKGKKNDAKGRTGDHDHDNSSSKGGKSKLKAATSVNVRHILCEKHSRKEEALTKLRDGTKFDDVARDFSEDKARQGGSLGWKVRGSLLKEFEDVAYELEPSTTASPKWGECKTSEGYHILMVEGRK